MPLRSSKAKLIYVLIFFLVISVLLSRYEMLHKVKQSDNQHHYSVDNRRFAMNFREARNFHLVVKVMECFDFLKNQPLSPDKENGTEFVMGGYMSQLFKPHP